MNALIVTCNRNQVSQESRHYVPVRKGIIRKLAHFALQQTCLRQLLHFGLVSTGLYIGLSER
jgi:hypothetical protein